MLLVLGLLQRRPATRAGREVRLQRLPLVAFEQVVQVFEQQRLIEFAAFHDISPQHFISFPRRAWQRVKRALSSRSHALRGNARRDALRPVWSPPSTRRRASRRAFPRRAWERGIGRYA